MTQVAYRQLDRFGRLSREVVTTSVKTESLIGPNVLKPWMVEEGGFIEVRGYGVANLTRKLEWQGVVHDGYELRIGEHSILT